MTKGKKKIVMYIFYGLVITAVFMYLLFPADVIKSRIENEAEKRNIALQVESLFLSLPMGLQFKNISVRSADQRNVFFQGEKLDLQANILSLFRKHSSLNISGKAYDGKFDGHIRFASLNKIYPPLDFHLVFQDILLEKYPLIKNELGKNLTGKIRGSLSVNNIAESYSKINGNITINLTKGSYPLAEPFLGINRIEIEQGEIKAQMKNGVLKLEKLELSGPQINCTLKGDITVYDDLKTSMLNLSGVVELSGKNKLKTNITITGTIANPVSRYI